jgi:hypothetical protein
MNIKAVNTILFCLDASGGHEETFVNFVDSFVVVLFAHNLFRMFRRFGFYACSCI